MAKTKKPKSRKVPMDPAEIARVAYERRRKPELWGTNDAALRLPSNADVQQIAETRTRTRRVFRFDCFETLKLEPDQVAAVRRLQDDIAIRFGVDGSAAKLSVQGGGSVDLVTQRSIDAARRVEAVLALTDPWHGELILALSEPTVTRGERANWHATVKRLLGLVDRGAQARAVRYAAEGLRRAWTEFDNGVRRAA